MKLNRHFVCYDNRHIHRRLFLCRICSKACIPCNFERYNGHKFYKIATSYVCNHCDAKFVTKAS